MFDQITSEEAVFVGSIEVAEASKLIENVQRDIDIAFANELSRVLPLMGIDVEEVLDVAQRNGTSIGTPQELALVGIVSQLTHIITSKLLRS